MNNIYICQHCGGRFCRDDIIVSFDPFGDNEYTCKKCYKKHHVDCICEGDETCVKPPEEPRTDAHHHTVYEQDNPTVDIHKIIDDAMEKGDRSVSIMIHNGITSVEVRPYVDEKVQWLYDGNKDYSWCSNCGYEDRGWDRSAYCPQCGELMHGARKVEKDDKV